MQCWHVREYKHLHWLYVNKGVLVERYQNGDNENFSLETKCIIKEYYREGVMQILWPA
jgi:hypothetical protein